MIFKCIKRFLDGLMDSYIQDLRESRCKHDYKRTTKLVDDANAIVCKCIKCGKEIIEKV